MRPLAALLATTLLAGCGGRYTSSRIDQDPLGLDYTPRLQAVDEPESLFPSDIAVLNDSAIKRILSYQLTLPRAGRLAVLQLGEQRNAWWRDSEDFSRLNQELTDSMLAALRRLPRIERAALLPSLMVPRQRTIPYLREAAARYQADLLLGYRTDCSLFRRTRFLQKAQYRATCSVEAVLLDTRSGIVPFTLVTTRSEVFEKQKQDFETREAIVRAQFRASNDALAEVAKQLGDFLMTTPESQP
ncbi:MAG TPA: hypothetical protein VGU74_15385 [Gemmatimonadales bacterium]|nr:hypothetical protein [Gemmatimonadales bacterium]